MKKLNLLVTVLLFAVHVYAADPLTERLQRGLFEEEANRNLDAAIKEYQSVVTSADEQRKVVATALFRLGECHRKLGRTNEAVAFYQRITRDFSEQEQLAKLAGDFLKPALVATGNKSVLTLELERKFAMLKVESITQQMEADRLASLSRHDLLNTDAVQKDAGYLSLMQQGMALSQKSTDLKAKQLGDDHPEMQALNGLRKKLIEQIDERVKAIVAGAQERAKQTAMQVQVFGDELKKAQNEAGAAPRPAPETAAATDDEEKEVRRIQAMIKDSPDLINARDINGQTPLHLATTRGQVVVAKFLIASRADVNARANNTGETPLHIAARLGHKSLVELLLNNGADVNAGKTSSDTPLHQAAGQGFRSVIEVLLARKADVNARDLNGETPLFRAVGRGFKAIAELLLAQGAEVNAKTSSDTTPLHLAARISNRDLVELLLAKGAAIDASDSLKITALQTAVQNKNLSILELLLAKKANPNLADQNGITPLSLAVQDGAVNLLGPLLAGGADPNIGDRNAITPLHWAAMLSGGEASAEVLLKNGASVTNKVSWAPGAQPPQSKGNRGVISERLTPLGLAIGYGQVRTAELLLDHGADVETYADYRNNGGTGQALSVALNNKDRPMVKLLLERKANPNIKSSGGVTPLMHAASMGNQEVVELLLAHGAEVNVLDLSGRYPLSFALNSPKPEIAELLRQRGAIEDLARSSSITVARGANRQTMFQKGTNDFNRHTLFEALAQHYTAGQNPFHFPDFARVQVRSIKSKAGEPGQTVDLETAFQFTNCAANTVLEWGDLIELPEQDHVMNMAWAGLSSFAKSTLRQCLRKQVSIIVKGQTNLVVLTPELPESQFSGYGSRPARFLNIPGVNNPPPAASVPAEPARPTQIDLNWQRLNDVVRNANVIRSSSDLTRVKVIRSGDERWEKVFDLTQSDKITDLWLRDGDVIEVPEKP